MLLIPCHLVQPEKGQFDFGVAWISTLLARTVTKGRCKEIHILEDRR